MNQDNSITVVPSFPAPDFTSLAGLASDMRGTAMELQIDIVDGVFVPLTAWPFTEEEDVLATLRKIKNLPASLSYEIDCMVVEPEQYLDVFVELGIKRVIVHHTSTEHYDVCTHHAQQHGYTIGLAVLPHVAYGDVRQLIAQFDYVQVMGIARVGQQGQPFAPEALTLIRAIRDEFPEKEIAVDGAVNRSTIPQLVAAGATRLAPGSAIVKAEDRVAAYQTLLSLANN